MPFAADTKEMTDEEAAELIREYKETGSVEARNKIVMHYSYIARMVAQNMNSTFSKYATVDEMINQGIIGLIECIDRFDPDKGVKFSTYAYTRVWGSIIDYVRKQDWLPRQIRKTSIEINKAEEKLSKKLKREPTREEMAKELKISVKEYDKYLYETSNESLASFETLLEIPIQVNSLMSYDDSYDPESQVGQKELYKVMGDAIDSLNNQERTVLSLYYYEGLTMREIGEIMGVREQRIGQVNKKLLSKLREKLSEYMKG